MPMKNAGRPGEITGKVVLAPLGLNVPEPTRSSRSFLMDLQGKHQR
jgi:hypothetical protein